MQKWQNVGTSVGKTCEGSAGRSASLVADSQTSAAWPAAFREFLLSNLLVLMVNHGAFTTWVTPVTHVVKVNGKPWCIYQVLLSLVFVACSVL